MPTTYYHTVNGRTIGETTEGVRTDYLTDALGSVTATVDQSQNVLNTYRYKPYGGLLAKTGSSPDPRFLWTEDTGKGHILVRSDHSAFPWHECIVGMASNLPGLALFKFTPPRPSFFALYDNGQSAGNASFDVPKCRKCSC